MDWSNEPYVRMYTRETDDDLALSWDALSVWRGYLLRCDRAGTFETKRGARGLAAVLRAPLEVVERALVELIQDGRLVQNDRGFVAPNFIEAQEANKSDRQRAKESRDRRRARNLDQPVTKRDANVTSGHTASQAVTLTSADPIPLQGSALLRDADPGSCDPTLREPQGSDPDRDQVGSHANHLPQHVPHGPARQHPRRGKLVRDAWNYGALKLQELKSHDGLDPDMPAWPMAPGTSYPPFEALCDRVDELLGDASGDADEAAETLRRRVDVAVATARRQDVRHLRWFTAARMWEAKSFAIDAGLSPEQAAIPRIGPRLALPANEEPIQKRRRL